MSEKLVEPPLPFKLAVRTTDAKWTVKAAFSTVGLAGATAIGMRHQGVACRIFAEGEDWTERAVKAAADAMKPKA